MSLTKERIKQIFFNDTDLIKFVNEDLQRQILEIAIEEDFSGLESVWKEVSENLQREYLTEVLEMDMYGDPFFVSSLWCTTQKRVQEDNPEIFLEIISQIHRDNDSLEIVMENTSENLLEKVIQPLLQINNLQNLPISPTLAQKIIDTTSCDIPIVLTIKDASELSVEQLEYFEASLKIQAIRIGDDKYEIDTYKTCRKKIYEKLKGIDLHANQGNPNREKYIFGQVIKRLANDICYDYELCEKEKSGEAIDEDSKNARNLVGGLIIGKCVCVGDAETVRNVFACCGIECINLGGDEHMWNQIKLDGEWFNMDFTWSRKRILKNEEPQYLLKSDEDFEGHKSSLPEKKKCSRTIPANELIKYIYGQQFKISPKHIANVGRNFCNQYPGDLQQRIDQVEEFLTIDYRGDIMRNE